MAMKTFRKFLNISGFYFYYLFVVGLFLLPMPFVKAQAGFWVDFGTGAPFQYATVSVAEKSKDDKTLVFTSSLDGSLNVFKVDSCGFIIDNYKISGFENAVRLYDVENIAQGKYGVLIQEREITNSFIFILFDEELGIEQAYRYTFPIDVIPNTLNYLVGEKWAVTLNQDVGILGDLVPILMVFENTGDIHFSKKTTIPFNPASGNYVDTHVASFQSDSIWWLNKDRITLLNAAGEPIIVKKVTFEELGGELARLVDVKPLIKNDQLYAVYKNNTFSTVILQISPQGEVVRQSAPFSFDSDVQATFFAIAGKQNRFDLHSYQDSMILLAGFPQAYMEPNKPVIYVWNDSLQLRHYNSLENGGGGVLSTSMLADGTVGFLMERVNKGLSLARTKPDLKLGCFDIAQLPSSFGQVVKHFLLLDDTMELTDIVVSKEQLDLTLANANFHQGEILCQTYYGPPLPAIEIDTFICLGAEIFLKYTHPTGTVVWEDGSTDSLFRVTEPGQYRATVHHCGTTQEVIFNVPDGKCPCVFEVPNAFTPNGDGINDSFGPVYQCYFADYQLRVYNRWGQEVFTSTDPAEGWDGTVSGSDAPSEVYIWHAVYTAWHEGQLFSRSAKGEVTLLR